MPIWEVTASQDADLGYTFNEPSLDPFSGGYRQIARVADDTGTDGKWRVIVGNGYGSTDGKAVLLMLDANTGVDTTSGAVPTKLTADTGPNNGLSAPTPVDTDRDGLIDTVYAGDLSGNMHKFQFSKLNTAATDYIVAKPGTTGGGVWRYIGVVYATGEPITTAPSVSPACDGNGWIVAFGTGKLNESGDYTDSSARGFYAVTDKMPSSTLPVASTSLATISHTTTTVSSRAVRDWTDPTLTGKSGWKMAFTGGERVLSNSTLPPDTGVVVFGTTKPSGDVCTPGNTGFIMSVNLCSGKSDTLSVAGMLVGGVGINSTGVVKVSNTYTNSGNKQTIVCNQDDCKGTGAPTVPTANSPKGRYSWRELFSK
jgi:type IV pilus assembly protein PilY1